MGVPLTKKGLPTVRILKVLQQLHLLINVIRQHAIASVFCIWSGVDERRDNPMVAVYVPQQHPARFVRIMSGDIPQNLFLLQGFRKP